ncbi:MAG: methionine transporter [Clostridiales bacterium]|jgi:ferredoxin|nr:methionine transporter [Clostridiales bacterium]
MKRRFTMKFQPESTKKPLTYHLIKDYNLKVNILRADITEGQEGRLLMEVEASKADLDKGLKFLESEGVTIIPLDQHLKWDKDNCIHCGACTAVCFSGALQMDRNTWEVNKDSEKCIVCGLCVSACPLKIITVEFR